MCMLVTEIAVRLVRIGARRLLASELAQSRKEDVRQGRDLCVNSRVSG